MSQVDKVIKQWLAVRPDLDVSTMLPLGYFSNVAKEINKATEKTLALHKLNIAGFDVLSTLRRSGPPYALSAGDLMESMMVTSGTMTNRIDQLVKAGLVKRETDPKDARRAMVCLTAQGFEKIEKAVLDHIASQKKILSPFSKDEAKTLEVLLRKLAKSQENNS